MIRFTLSTFTQLSNGDTTVEPLFTAKKNSFSKLVDIWSIIQNKKKEILRKIEISITRSCYHMIIYTILL